jgi:hypothetical protein
MALNSPGSEVTIINESFYLPADQGTTPLVVVATEQDKTIPGGTAIAAGTTKANAGKINLVGSQRELASLFGTPKFYTDNSGTPIHGHELNEYGLFAAYSFLGVANRAYVVRADIDLAELTGSTTAPTGNVAAGTYWLDTSSATRWGVLAWDADNQAFDVTVPKVIVDSANVTGSAPIQAFGSIGDYAVVATSTSNPVYYKNISNTWVQVGSNAWKLSWPAVQGTVASPTVGTGQTLVINGTNITTTGTTLSSVVTSINSAGGAFGSTIVAAAVSNKLVIKSTSTVTIGAGSTAGLLTALGLTAGSYAAPALQLSKHTSVPSWKSTDATPRPSGSVWVKTTNPNSGANIVVKKFTSADTWETVPAPLYANNTAAVTALAQNNDPSTISAGKLYVQYDPTGSTLAGYKIFRWEGAVPLVVTGTATSPALATSDAFTLNGTVVTLTGGTSADFVTAVSAANITDVSARINADGSISILHAKGGDVVLVDGTGSPLAGAGINVGTNSNWLQLTYTAKASEPTDAPVEDRRWYDTNTSKVDVMVHDGSTWKGYQNVYANCDPEGVITSASTPEEQTDGTALEEGDLWLDTGDTENYPVLYRYTNSEWVAIDNTDQTTENGIVFADARNTDDGESTGSTDAMDLLASDYLDPDAPDPDLYPRGTLLWNTRISGGVVRRYVGNYLNATDYPAGNERMGGSPLPNTAARWVNDSGNKTDGSPYMGRKAQRAVIVQAMTALINSNEDIRAEQRAFNLLAAPGYVEMLQPLVVLNNDRNQTAFIVADTPMRLAPTSNALQGWAQNTAGSPNNGDNGLTTAYDYAAVFYPSGFTTDLEGNDAVVPPSHIMLRTIALSDQVSFPWFAPAGLRRGVIDNASNVGYINPNTREFETVVLSEGLRDTMYLNKMNPLTVLPTGGIVNYGQKTLSAANSALDRINVARLIVYIRTQLDRLVKPYLFEPNDKLTRDEIKQQVESFFNELVGNRALYDYLVVCDETNNTPDRIDRNELYIDIAIEPVKAVEFIYIPVRIKNTGEIASLG